MILHGDSLELMKALPDNSVDSIVTDPPYGLSFMGKKWDYDVPSVELWAEALRVLKPGGHLLAFAGTRTQHRMAVRIEDAGFEIRDMIMWCYGSGFPKSLDVSKAIDKAAGVDREVIGTNGTCPDIRSDNYSNSEGKERLPINITAPATDSAKQWEGWGTALKPALEPITVARKPFPGTVAQNVLEWGTGGLNVDGCRVETDSVELNARKAKTKPGAYDPFFGKRGTGDGWNGSSGRFPANLIHDGSDEVVGLFPQTKSGYMGPSHKRSTNGSPNGIYGKFDVNHPLNETYADSGSAARFFYCAKASKAERTVNGQVENTHPTVKPVALMRYLCRLVTPPGGVVLDPFCGSGTTGISCKEEGFDFIGMERDEHSVITARERIEAWGVEKKEDDSQLSLF